MSLHSVYCSVCFKYVEVNLAGHIYEFMDHTIRCPCIEEETVVVKRIYDNGKEYGLFNVCDLVPSVEIVQTLLKAQGKPLMHFS